MNKQKLIEKWESAIEAAEYYGKDEEDRLIEYMRDFVEDLTQLDEPEVTLDKAFEKVAESYSMAKEEVWWQLEQFEAHAEVLSRDWIKDHELLSTEKDADGNIHADRYIHVKDLQNLLVPKQTEITEEQAWEKISEYYPVKQAGLKSAFEHFYYGGFMTDVVAKKPVIPQFVADWIEKMKQDERPLYSVMSNLMNKTNHTWAVWKSAEKNFSEVVAQAWLYDYTVEKEQKYRVIFPSVDESGKGFNYLAKDCYHKELWVEDARTDGLVWEERSSFTENEIRDLDKGDILFEHFAVKVEDMEE